MNDRTLKKHIETARTIKDDIERLQIEYERHAAIIRAEMDARNTDKYTGDKFPYIVTYKHITVNRFDSVALKAENPAIYKEYTKQTSETRLTIKKNAV